MTKYELYIGIVAIDKPYNQRYIKAFIPELFPFYQGDLTDTTITESVTTKVLDKDIKIDVNTSQVITAEYLDFHANRFFPPDIRKGEYVLILKYRDNDIYYWIPTNFSIQLRKYELYRIFASNSENINEKLSEDNTYYIELDTLYNKSIILRTSKSDNEKFRYIIHIDAKNNSISIKDDDENYIILQSDIPRIKLHNKNNSFIDINKDDIFINAPRDLRINVGRMTYINTESFVIDNKDACIINTNNFGINASNISLVSGTIGMDSSVKVSGTLVANAIRSGSYGTGSVGSMYPSPTANTDISSGSTTTPSSSPDTNDSIGTMRHTAAWEQVSAALNIIASCLEEIDSKIGLGCSYSSINSLANNSIMNKNKGE